MLFLSPTYGSVAERAMAGPETAPRSARVPAMTFAQVVAARMPGGSLCLPPQGGQPACAPDRTTAPVPEDDTGPPAALPDAADRLHEAPAELAAPDQGGWPENQPQLEDDEGAALQVGSAAHHDRAMPLRAAAAAPVPELHDLVAGAATPSADDLSANPVTDRRAVPGASATLSAMGPVPAHLAFSPLGPTEGAPIYQARFPAQPLDDGSGAPSGRTDHAAGAMVDDVSLSAQSAQTPLPQLPDDRPPDARVLMTQTVLPPTTKGVGHDGGDLAPGRNTPAHPAPAPAALHDSQDSALPLAALMMPGVAPASNTDDISAAGQAQTTRSKAPSLLLPGAQPAGYEQGRVLDFSVDRQTPLPASDLPLSAVPDRQAGQGPNAPATAFSPRGPVPETPLPHRGGARQLAGIPEPHILAPQPQPQPQPQPVAPALTQFAGRPGAGVPAGLIPLAMVGADVNAETETALPAGAVRVAPGGPGATAQPPQALVAQPPPGGGWPGGWPMAELPATVQPVPVGAAPSAPATKATLPLEQPQAAIMPRDQMAHWPVIASPPSEPALVINTGSTSFPLPAHAGSAADPVDWRAQQLYAGFARSLKPAEAVLAAGRDDAMLARAVTVDQAMPAPQPAMPAGAQAVTRQMADTIAQVVQRGQSGQITVHLSPVELGRVEIAMQPREAGMALIILAERPEVLDLLRRHIDQLADDMRALGYSDLSFQFGAGTDRRGEAAADPDRTAHLADTGASAESTPPPETPVAQTRQDGRLDLRY